MRALKSYILKRKYLFIALIGFIILAPVLVTHFLMPPSDTPDTLDLLYCSPYSISSPTFRMQSQQTYHLANSQELSLTISDGSELSPTAEANGQELSLTQSAEPIHLMVSVNGGNFNIDALLDELSKLSLYAPSITLSLIPEDIDDEAYIELVSSLHSRLDSISLGCVELIWYPKDVNKLKLYDMDIVKNIGVVIQSSADLSTLKLIYNHFENSTKLYIRDNISHFYKDNVSKAVQEINTVYHLLAVQYPKVTTIFSPYRTNTMFPTDEYYLDSSDDNYSVLASVYYQLANKPWITFANTEVSNTSPYQVLNSYTRLSGEVEIILDPRSNIVSNIPEQAPTSSNAIYLTYKIDEQVIPVQAYYPYSMHLDTTAYANGVSRIKASSYTKDNQLVETQSVDIEFANPINTTRPKRIKSSYAPSSKAIYKRKYIPILMYHSILDSVSEDEQNSCVEISVFDSQIKALIDNGYTPINFKTLNDYIAGTGGLPEKPILITMDDGYLNNYTNAYPIYKKYGVQATLFVSPYYMSEENTDRHFGWLAAREMEESGLIDIQSHGYNHTPFPYISLKELKYHVSHSFGMIEQHLGSRDVYVVACPQFRNTIYTRKLLTSLGIDLQITKLAWRGTVLDSSKLKRINVPNTMTPDELIKKIESLTM